MKYGIREICDVVLRAKAKMTVGNKIFYKNEPVIYFDSLKTSTLEGAATTVYAQGGRGNSRLIAWEGERTITFTMEDALISTVGLAILTGADVIEATEKTTVKQHITETVEVEVSAKGIIPNEITLNKKAYKDGENDCVYVMFLDDTGNPVTEPYIYVADGSNIVTPKRPQEVSDVSAVAALIDYYTERLDGAQQIEITPDKFGGNFYLEASTLFRDTNGQDLPAEFIIPNCKVQSNFTFTMASSGDPSTFTFTMDAFPDYTRWNKTKKVLSAIQIFNNDALDDNSIRLITDAYTDTDGDGDLDMGEEMTADTLGRFTIDGSTYLMSKSSNQRYWMTWAEWCESRFNTAGLVADSETNTVTHSDTNKSISLFGRLVQPKDRIQTPQSYSLTSDFRFYIWTKPTENYYPEKLAYQASPGMTWTDICNQEDDFTLYYSEEEDWSYIGHQSDPIEDYLAAVCDYDNGGEVGADDLIKANYIYTKDRPLD